MATSTRTRQGASNGRQSRNPPEKIFRIGNISASVWLNHVDLGNGETEIRNVSLQRRYRDDDDWKYTSSLSLQDLPAAIRVMQLAQQHIEQKEAIFDGR